MSVLAVIGAVSLLALTALVVWVFLADAKMRRLIRQRSERCPDCGSPWAKHKPGRGCECKGEGKGCQCQLDRQTAQKEAEDDETEDAE